MSSATNPSSAVNDAVQEWLTQRVALYLDREPADLEPETPLQQYGLDSVYAVAFCGDVEEHFGVEIELTLAWDHPTLAAITRYLHGLLGDAGPVAEQAG
ncbi:acyl carrier protein [Actinomadura violacea]|uniref:Acyl carrier protein n=1 Tax=Actinomadura violacea TaxID=2819934 RepID=A0ABS3RNH8_9ACTN|nr:acyl carrier protein [Actinomadura violacea]MBO2458309.1 acyl carrier protein [Actinomadura violacea]